METAIFIGLVAVAFVAGLIVAGASALRMYKSGNRLKNRKY